MCFDSLIVLGIFHSLELNSRFKKNTTESSIYFLLNSNNSNWKKTKSNLLSMLCSSFTRGIIDYKVVKVIKRAE